jgi:hypothetical protein
MRSILVLFRPTGAISNAIPDMERTDEDDPADRDRGNPPRLARPRPRGDPVARPGRRQRALVPAALDPRTGDPGSTLRTSGRDGWPHGDSDFHRRAGVLREPDGGHEPLHRGAEGDRHERRDVDHGRTVVVPALVRPRRRKLVGEVRAPQQRLGKPVAGHRPDAAPVQPGGMGCQLQRRRHRRLRAAP